MQEVTQNQKLTEREKSHTVSITARLQIDMTGIESVTAFYPHEIALYTYGGKLIVTGEDLKITQFCKETGSFTATGKFTGLRYGSSDRLRKFFR